MLLNSPNFLLNDNQVDYNGIFRSIGSIYFKKDVPAELQAVLYIASTEKCEDSEIFCIGPTADYMFWYEGRAGLNLRCGPCECNFHYFEVQILIITGNDPKIIFYLSHRRKLNGLSGTGSRENLLSRTMMSSLGKKTSRITSVFWRSTLHWHHTYFQRLLTVHLIGPLSATQVRLIDSHH